MAWKKAPEELVNFLSETTKDIDCQFRKMFGYPAYFINNYMFIAAHEENVILRVSQDDKQKALADINDVKKFEPMPGRIMKDYIVIPDSVYNDKKIFSEMLSKSVEYVSSLPPKEKKKKKKK